MHHLITVEQGEYLIDGQPVGPHRSVDALVEFLQQDTLGCINCELIDVCKCTGFVNLATAAHWILSWLCSPPATGVLTFSCVNLCCTRIVGGDDNFDGGSGYPAGNGDPVYDSAGGVTEGHTGGGLYDAVPADGYGYTLSLHTHLQYLLLQFLVSEFCVAV